MEQGDPRAECTRRDDRGVGRVRRTVTDTLLAEMTAGPMGRTHPAVGNLPALREATTTTTGTGGPLDATAADHSK